MYLHDILRTCSEPDLRALKQRAGARAAADAHQGYRSVPEDSLCQRQTDLAESGPDGSPQSDSDLAHLTGRFSSIGFPSSSRKQLPQAPAPTPPTETAAETLAPWQEKIIDRALSCPKTRTTFEAPVYLHASGYTVDRSVLAETLESDGKGFGWAIPDYALHGLSAIWRQRHTTAPKKLYAQLVESINCCISLEAFETPYLTGSGFTYSSPSLSHFLKETPMGAPLGLRDHPVGIEAGAINNRVASIVTALTMPQSEQTKNLSLLQYDLGKMFTDLLWTAKQPEALQDFLFDKEETLKLARLPKLFEDLIQLDSPSRRFAPEFGSAKQDTKYTEQSEVFSRLSHLEAWLRDMIVSVQRIFQHTQKIELERLLMITDALMLQTVFLAHNDRLYFIADQLADVLRKYPCPAVNVRVAFLVLNGTRSKKPQLSLLREAQELLDSYDNSWILESMSYRPGKRASDFFMPRVCYFAERRMLEIKKIKFRMGPLGDIVPQTLRQDSFAEELIASRTGPFFWGLNRPMAHELFQVTPEYDDD